MDVSVVIPTHNPEPNRLRTVLAGLSAQTLPRGEWEVLIVDNASVPPVEAHRLAPAQLSEMRIVREPELGLTAARRRGVREARGRLLVFVDDDNVLAPDYLAEAARIFQHWPHLGAAGGKSLPAFETSPPEWTREFFALLALRDLGSVPLIAEPSDGGPNAREEYPICAPLGAGMVLRREPAEVWLRSAAASDLSDRRGDALTSAGDNDIVFATLAAKWSVGYFPTLQLTHLIPASRLQADYLARLNRGIQCSWMQVLTRHGANQWEPLTPLGARLRQWRAWFRHRPWQGPAQRVRWTGACGHFEGRVPRVQR